MKSLKSVVAASCLSAFMMVPLGAFAHENAHPAEGGHGREAGEQLFKEGSGSSVLQKASGKQVQMAEKMDPKDEGSDLKDAAQMKMEAGKKGAMGMKDAAQEHAGEMKDAATITQEASSGVKEEAHMMKEEAKKEMMEEGSKGKDEAAKKMGLGKEL